MLKQFNFSIDKNYRTVLIIFFALVVCIGASAFKDYGIAWDEVSLRVAGIASVKYMLHRDRDLFSLPPFDLYHGPVFQILLVAIEAILNLTQNSKAVFLMRHLVTFLLFCLGLLFFYLLCKRIFSSWRLGLLGSLFLLLSPRIFAHSFYNSKDIPFLVLFIISIYTLLRYLDEKSLYNAFTHAGACALLIDLRLIGIFVVILTVVFVLVDLLAMLKQKNTQREMASLFVYITLLSLFTVLFWPLLWSHPIGQFINQLKMTMDFPWRLSVLYLGKYIQAQDLPGHYVPLSLLITTPLLYSGCFLIGCFGEIKLLCKRPKQLFLERRDNLIYLLWFFGPLIGLMIFRPVVYDLWRQFFFIYPALLILCLAGLRQLDNYFKLKFPGRIFNLAKAALILIVAFNLINTARFMITNHPHQNVYFNRLAGKDMEEAKANFELDYWGLSYRQALEYILRNDSHKRIKVYVANFPGEANALILNSADRDRLVYVRNPEESNYFLSNYRWHKEEYPYQEYYSIKVGGAKIMAVYKIN